MRLYICKLYTYIVCVHIQMYIYIIYENKKILDICRFHLCYNLIETYKLKKWFCALKKIFLPLKYFRFEGELEGSLFKRK